MTDKPPGAGEGPVEKGPSIELIEVDAELELEDGETAHQAYDRAIRAGYKSFRVWPKGKSQTRTGGFVAHQYGTTPKKP